MSGAGTIREPGPVVVEPKDAASAAAVLRHSAGAASGGEGGLGAADLAQLMRSFNEVTSRLVATHESLTAQVRQLQGELREANREVERSRHLAALGEMAAGIAHEVRNPLGSIMLYARMLEQDLAGQGEPLAVARKITGAVSRLNAVVTDFLAFSREQRIRPAEVDAHDLMRSALEDASGDGSLSGGVVVQGPDAVHPPVTVRCDAGLVQQALVNIIRNALEAVQGAPRGRQKVVLLEAGLRPVRWPDGSSREMVVLGVHDSGPGFPAESAERLCNPFFTTRASGTGLGLAIVHRIVDAHGGRLSLRNETGPDGTVRGARVEIMLPARGAAEGDAQK